MNPVDAGLLPDPVIRFGIRRLLASRLREERRRAGADREAALRRHADQLRNASIAVHADDANDQHYEVPPRFFELVLGRRLKYSSGYWPEPGLTLDDAEKAALELVAERADVQDGQRVLDLGCGWGSLTLFLAERFRQTHVTAVSNSHAQRRFILDAAERRGLDNVEVVTSNVADLYTTPLEPSVRFDRICSIEMLEHVRNYELLFHRMAGWLAPDGKVFVHIFTHARYAYLFEDNGPSDWMARHFFSGGQMPASDLLLQFQNDLAVTQRWLLDGRHYQKTAEAWLERLDERRDEVTDALSHGVDLGEARRRANRWRVFFMAVAELFGYRSGTEWGVSHYLLEPQARSRRPLLPRNAHSGAGSPLPATT